MYSCSDESLIRSTDEAGPGKSLRRPSRRSLCDTSPTGYSVSADVKQHLNKRLASKARHGLSRRLHNLVPRKSVFDASNTGAHEAQPGMPSPGMTPSCDERRRVQSDAGTAGQSVSAGPGVLDPAVAHGWPLEIAAETHTRHEDAFRWQPELEDSRQPSARTVTENRFGQTLIAHRPRLWAVEYDQQRS